MNYFNLTRDFLRDVWHNRFVIYQLTKRDYKNRYIGSTLGFIWSIIQPLVMLLVLWVVFEKGFNSGPIIGSNGQVIPFIAWFTLGLIAWNFYAETTTAITGVFQEYSYLIKKVNFKLATLPIVKIISSLITHGIFLIIALLIMAFSGISFSWYWFQVFYYLIALMVLLLGLGWMLSSIQVFLRDVTQIVAVVLNIGFWMTPVVWNLNIVPPEYQNYFKLNPMFYIVEGYRNSFLFHQPFWHRPQQMIAFWGFTFLVLILGVILFRRLRPHFPDVL